MSGPSERARRYAADVRNYAAETRCCLMAAQFAARTLHHTALEHFIAKARYYANNTWDVAENARQEGWKP